jgi:hypothetical protein
LSEPFVSGTYAVVVVDAQPLFDPRYELPYLSIVLRITEGPFAGRTLRDASREDPTKGPVGRLQPLAGDAETIGDLIGRTALATVAVRGSFHTPEILTYSQKDA